jgi:hypothetical protein
MKHLRIVAVILGLAMPAEGARADDYAKPTGMWQWSFPRAWPETALYLRGDGNQVTGFLIGNTGWEKPISNGNYKDGTVSFQVPGRFSTFTYTGKLSGDTIQGQIRIDGNSRTYTRPWKAVRVDSRDPSGTWMKSVSINGKTRVTILRFELEDEKLTGTITPSNGKAKTIEEGTFKDGNMTFLVRESQSGKEYICHYSLHLLGDTIIGQTEVGGGSGPLKATRIKE